VLDVHSEPELDVPEPDVDPDVDPVPDVVDVEVPGAT
jgi:hypothetical protein